MNVSRVSPSRATKTSNLVATPQTIEAYGVATLTGPLTRTAYTMTGNWGMAAPKPFPAHPTNQGNIRDR